MSEVKNSETLFFCWNKYNKNDLGLVFNIPFLYLKFFVN